MIKSPENVALFDMDGTLCDYESHMLGFLESIKSPDEISYQPHFGRVPDYIQRRKDLISSSEEFWSEMPKFQLGFDVLKISRELGFRNMILTQAPRNKPKALSGKRMWLEKNLPDLDFTMTRDKGLVYGKVLVDDFPPYIEKWLEWRKNGVVIMPAGKHNEGYIHKQLVRYDGTNLEEVKERMKWAKYRK